MVRITPKFQDSYYIENDLHRKITAEFAASFFQVYIGLCVNAQSLLSGANDNVQNSIGWGLALLFAVQLSLNITGNFKQKIIRFC